MVKVTKGQNKGSECLEKGIGKTKYRMMLNTNFAHVIAILFHYKHYS